MLKNNRKEYIWHCPGEDCRKKGTIILKTWEPHLGDGEIKCPGCNKVFTLFDIIVYNKKNVKKYLKILSNG